VDFFFPGLAENRTPKTLLSRKVLPARPSPGSQNLSNDNEIANLRRICEEVFGETNFVNSFVAVPKDPTIIAATSDYYGRYVCAVQWKNITATQFHPEKSGDYGLCTLKRWLQ